MRPHRRIICGLAIASLSVVGFAPIVLTADTPPINKTAMAAPAAPTFPEGFTVKQADAAPVQKALARVTDHAVTKGAFAKLAGDLVNQDQERIEQYKKTADEAKLDGRVAELQKAWKTKYGTDFDIDKAQNVFNEMTPIARGEVNDAAVAMAHWPAAVTGNEAVTAGERNPAANDADKKIDKGREVALIRFPAENGLPEMTVSMLLQHIDHWVVDIPNDRTGQQVYDDVLSHLTYLGEHAETWPADVNQAYRLVAHHTMAALYGIPTPSKNG